MKSLSKHVAFLIQFILVGLGIAFVWLFFQGRFNISTVDNSPAKKVNPTHSISDINTHHTTPTITHQGHLSFASAVEVAQPAVVSIVTTKDILIRTPQGIRSGHTPPGLGSGVVVDKEGYILTNHHVIQGVDTIAIILTDGRASEAEIVGTDPDTDLALLYVPDLSANSELASLDFANSDNLHIGDIVLAIGNQYGIGQTVTQGIVSAQEDALTHNSLNSKTSFKQMRILAQETLEVHSSILMAS